MTVLANASSPNGRTSVVLSSELVNALTSLGVQAGGFGDTRIRNGVARFSITGGSIDRANTKVEIIHSGGLTLRAGGREVALTDFVISNLGGQPVLTGLVTVNGDIVTRAPLFNLQIGRASAGTRLGRSPFNANNVRLTLTDVAAGALNQAFGVTAFAGGFNIGTARVNTVFNARTGNVGDRLLPVQDFVGNTPSLFPGATQDVLPRGRTSVDLSDTLVNALGSLNVQASGFGGTRIRDGIADFLITGGAAELAATKVEIFHKGGLTLSNRRTNVNLTDFVISNVNNAAVLTGTVTANGTLVDRIPLFNLQVGGVAATPGSIQNLDLTNVNVTLSSDAAGALNSAFRVNAFTAGLSVGTAQVDAFVA